MAFLTDEDRKYTTPEDIIAHVGDEYAKFLGAIAAAPEKQICGPVAGTIGVYVFEVISRDTGAFYTEDDVNNLKLQMNQYNAQMILPVMEEATNYKDNRARFF